MAERARRRRLRARLAWLAAGLVAALVLVELGLRAIGYEPVTLPPPGKSFFIAPSDFPGLEYELVPGASGRGWGTRVEVNSLGFRGREVARAKPEGVVRVAVIGDSVAFGNELPAETTFPSLLEELLAAGGGSPPVEVLNLGVGGYDVLNAVAMLEHRGLPLDPDIVVLSLCLNDAGIMSGNLRYVEQLERYRTPLYRSRLAQLVGVRLDALLLRRAMDAANDDDAFARRYRGRIADLGDDARALELVDAVRAAIPERWGSLHPSLRWWGSVPRVGRVRWALERLAALSREHGFEVVVAALPYLVEEPEAGVYARIDALIEHETRRVGFDLVSLRDAFAAAGLETLRIRADDPIHPNERGHAIAADRLYEHLHPRIVAR